MSTKIIKINRGDSFTLKTEIPDITDLNKNFEFKNTSNSEDLAYVI